jgi:VanZ family protein
MGYPKRTLIFIVLMIASAFGLEALQLLTPDRHGRVIDAVVKAAGGICGVGVGRFALLLLERQAQRIYARLGWERPAS